MAKTIAASSVKYNRMAYRTPWVDEEGRKLDEAEIAAFGAMLRAQRGWVRFVVAFVVTILGAIALAAASVPREPAVIVFERKPECVYDGCFCRGEHGLVDRAIVGRVLARAPAESLGELVKLRVHVVPLAQAREREVLLLGPGAQRAFAVTSLVSVGVPDL